MSLKPSGPEGTKSCQDSNSTSAVNTTEPAGPKHSRKRKLSTSDAADNLSKRIHRTSDHFQMTIDPSPGAVVGSLDGFQPELSSKPGIPQGRSEAGSGFFPHSQNLVFHNPTMIDNSKHVYTNERLSKALEWLAKNIMHGAEFDSSARDPPPRCHPGTRTSIIEKAQDWVQNDKRERKLWWLRGPAGVGKSAIVQTLAESQYQARRLGASIFFSRPNGRNNPRQVLPSIAYQFAVRDRAYKSYIADLMTTDPNCLQKSMGEQFRILIVEPFAVMQIRSQSETCVVALDGLDECAGDQTETWSLGLVHPYGRHSDRAQCEIVRLVSDFILQYPLVPLIWIIASRPEPHLKAVFQSDRVRLGFWAEDVPVDSEEAFRDVEKYLHTEFSRIRQDYPDLIPTTPTWPSNAHFLAIAKGSSGLFAFASVIVRFIDDPWIGNPVAQLDCVLSALSRMINSQQQNPLAALDALYTEIISRISPGVLQTTKRLLGSLIFLERSHVNVSDCGFRCICNLLDIKRDVAVSALRNLHSVLRIPEAEEIANDRPRFYHASFQDYLEEPLRSHEYWIDQASFGKELFWGSVRLMKALYYRELYSGVKIAQVLTVFL
ncbi:hypothetical protein P691DRAFT_107543 [Macrolepiota fuliginosa MF-IS2]|uniref:Nephrocystin 3-like N-terminal domain-containing protein n=1 Tax=Macrolepiota fuliginosa MF-IS2 TaxID=1400762 RepID=A0A9P6C3L8_9AGAR|nr:hypothetical protein P691DRAFT_107543 [Macrolepiota fuliginosa MF-IS2]